MNNDQKRDFKDTQSAMSVVKDEFFPDEVKRDGEDTILGKEAERKINNRPYFPLFDFQQVDGKLTPVIIKMYEDGKVHKL